MRTMTKLIVALILMSQYLQCQVGDSEMGTTGKSNEISYEFVISRSSDDLVPSISGATIAVAKLDKDQLNIELIFRVGRRFSFSMFTDDAALDFYPVWGPDDKSIYFDSNRNQKISIWNLSLSENTPRIAVESDSGMCFGAAISPNKSQMAYTKSSIFDYAWWTFYISPPVRDIRPEHFQIVLRRLDDGVDNILTYGMLPSWSPNGKRIAYSFFNGSDWDIWAIEPSTGKKFRLTDTKDNDFYISWSPDGEWLAYCRENPITKNTDIWLIRSNGGSSMQLTTNQLYNEGAPFWTSDGIYIHTDTGENTPYDIALIPSELLPTAPQASSSAGTSRLSVERANVRIQILNSTGKSGLAGKVSEMLEENGFIVSDVGNSKKERNLSKGKIYYKTGYHDIANEIAELIPGTQRLYESKAFGYDIVVVLGKNTSM